jgi:probable HAF family extracellular repeat protein
MNKAGEVVGNADDANGDMLAVAWNGPAPSVVFGVNPHVGGYTDAVAINSQGVIVGNGNDIGEVGFSDFVFEIGPNVSAYGAYLRGIDLWAINDANVAVGIFEGTPAFWGTADSFGQLPNFLPPLGGGCICDSHGMPTGINAAGIIVGAAYVLLPDGINFHSVAVRWKPDPNTKMPGATVKALAGLGGRDSGASAVNASDWVVGWATLGNKLQRAVLWEGNNGPFDLGTLGGKESSANGINAEGDVVGEAQTASGAWHAVVWTHLDFKATDLNLEISPALAKQFTLTSAADTNDRCMVLANGVDNKTGAQESFVLSLTEQSRCNEP